MVYLHSIRVALIACPILALFLAFFFICWQYRKYGAISKYRALVSYMFMLFCVSAYCLVILPLPDPAVVAKRTGPTMQLIPFEGVKVFFRDSGFSLFHPNSYIKSLKSPEFYQPLFNFFLLFPLGCFLRYLFNCSKKKAWILSFSMTLFFELTQLSGLYGYYVRPYRVFDVDDLILNATGSMFGFWVMCHMEKFLPKWDKINSKVYKKGQLVKLRRRYIANIIDSLIIHFFALNFFGIGCIIYGCIIYVFIKFSKNGIPHYIYPDGIILKVMYVMVYLIIEALYISYYIFKHDGTTFGKRRVGIGLSTSDGTVLTKRRIYLRYGLRDVSRLLCLLFLILNGSGKLLVLWLCDIIYTRFVFKNKGKYRMFFYERISKVVNCNMATDVSSISKTEKQQTVENVEVVNCENF